MRFGYVLVWLLWWAGSGRSVEAQITLENAFSRLTFTEPVFLTHAPDTTNRIFLVQQNGFIKVFSNNSEVGASKTFLNISSRISHSSEEGLLGLAFHPDYANNGYFYVDYTTATAGPRRTVIARYHVDPSNPDSADPNSEVRLLEVFQPYTNHNAGMIFFGLDGYLYITFGDGGSGGDPGNRAQNLDSLLGKILRIDVDTTTDSTAYGIPPDNPFVGTGHRPEIFTWGMRNPWRMSQDSLTGQIWVGDVGQELWEEVDLLEKGHNYGWHIMEGAHCYNPSSGCDTTGLTMPVKEYSSGPGSGNQAVTGGYVYRGSRRPELYGYYIYADYASGRIWRFHYDGGPISGDSLIIDSPYAISSFGEDQNHECYMLSYATGVVYAFTPPPVGIAPAQHAPHGFLLRPNYPNPFNPGTTIPYTLASQAPVELKIFDVLGHEIRTLVDAVQSGGEHHVAWDGKDRKGRSVASGVYLIRLRTPTENSSRKMILLK